MRDLRDLRKDDRGATAVEYGLILALIFLAMVVGVVAVGNSTQTLWGNIADKVRDA